MSQHLSLINHDLGYKERLLPFSSPYSHTSTIHQTSKILEAQRPIQAIIKPHLMKPISKLIVIAIIYLLCFVDASPGLILRLETLNHKTEMLAKEIHEHKSHTAEPFDEALVERIAVLSREMEAVLDKAKVDMTTAILLLEEMSQTGAFQRAEWEWDQWKKAELSANQKLEL